MIALAPQSALIEEVRDEFASFSSASRALSEYLNSVPRYILPSRTFVETSSSRVQPILEKLFSFERLGPNWDTYGAEPVSHEALDLSRRLVRAIEARLMRGAPGTVRPFFVAPTSDGGIQFEWKTTDIAAELEISPDRALALLIDQPLREDRFEEVHPEGIEEALERLENLLRA